MAGTPSILPLTPLFAPYCGGLGREQQLIRALEILAAGCLPGVRRLSDGGGHAYELAWSGEPAPLQTLDCQLHFPDQPEEISYRFPLVCHQLVLWLVESGGDGLPDSFWPWLLQGRSVETTELTT